jgi:hypothetical protein
MALAILIGHGSPEESAGAAMEKECLRKEMITGLANSNPLLAV